MFDRINNRMDEAELVADLYQVMSAFRAMPDGLTKYHIPRAIFKLTSPSNSYGSIEDFKAILEGSELDLRKRFYQHRDSNYSGLRESDGTYSRAIRAEGERQYDKYKLDKYDPIDAVSTFFIADNKARLDYIKTGKDYERDIGDEGWVNPRLLEVQQRRRLGDMGGIINDILDDMFNDDATQLTTNTDINSTLLDDQLIANFIERSKQSPTSKSSVLSSPSSTIAEAGSAIAEAGSGEVDVENVIRRKGRPPGSKNKDTIRREQEEGLRSLNLMGAKGGGIQ